MSKNPSPLSGEHPDDFLLSIIEESLTRLQSWTRGQVKSWGLPADGPVFLREQLSTADLGRRRRWLSNVTAMERMRFLDLARYSCTLDSIQEAVREKRYVAALALALHNLPTPPEVGNPLASRPLGRPPTWNRQAVQTVARRIRREAPRLSERGVARRLEELYKIPSETARKLMKGRATPQSEKP